MEYIVITISIIPIPVLLEKILMLVAKKKFSQRLQERVGWYVKRKRRSQRVQKGKKMLMM